MAALVLLVMRVTQDNLEIPEPQDFLDLQAQLDILVQMDSLVLMEHRVSQDLWEQLDLQVLYAKVASVNYLFDM